VYQIGTENRTLITCIVCCNVENMSQTPMLIYPKTRFTDFNPEDISEDTINAQSPNGCTSQEFFVVYIRSFIEETKDLQKPIVLFLDGHNSHASYEVSILCEENGIILYVLLAHASHVIQPLYVGIIKTLKAKWKKQLKKHNMVEIVTKKLSWFPLR